MPWWGWDALGDFEPLARQHQGLRQQLVRSPDAAQHSRFLRMHWPLMYATVADMAMSYSEHQTMSCLLAKPALGPNLLRLQVTRRGIKDY